VNKEMHGVEMLCLSGFKSLLIDKRNWVMGFTLS